MSKSIDSGVVAIISILTLIVLLLCRIMSWIAFAAAGVFMLAVIVFGLSWLHLGGHDPWNMTITCARGMVIYLAAGSLLRVIPILVAGSEP